MSKVLELLKQSKSVAQRAAQYTTSLKRDIQRDVIDPLIARKEKLDDELFDLTNFSLETDMNAGCKQMTKEDVLTRFKRIIQIEYELRLISLELDVKQSSYENYFGETPEPTVSSIFPTEKDDNV
jgi:hypothetical protein